MFARQRHELGETLRIESAAERPHDRSLAIEHPRTEFGPLIRGADRGRLLASGRCCCVGARVASWPPEEDKSMAPLAWSSFKGIRDSCPESDVVLRNMG